MFWIVTTTPALPIAVVSLLVAGALICAVIAAIKPENLDIYVERGNMGKFRWFIYDGDEYKGHSGALGFENEDQAWADAKRLMRGYKFRRGIPKP